MNTKTYIFSTNKSNDWFIGTGELNSITNRFEGVIFATEYADAIFHFAIKNGSPVSFEVHNSIEIVSEKHYEEVSERVTSVHLIKAGIDYDVRRKNMENLNSPFNVMKKILKENTPIFQKGES